MNKANEMGVESNSMTKETCMRGILKMESPMEEAVRLEKAVL